MDNEIKELKKKVAYLEKDNEVGQEAFRDMIKMKEENEKLKKENEELKKNEGWWRHEIVKLLGWDEKEGAKWNSPYEHDVKVRDIFETLEGYIFAVRGGNQHDCETGEVNGYSPSLKQIKKENEKLNIKLKNSAKITKFVQKKVDKLKKELERTEKEKNNHKKFVDIFEERMGVINNNYCCGHEPQYNIPMDEIDERLKIKDNIDLALGPLFKIIKHLKKDIFTQHAEYGTLTDIKKIDVLRKQYMDFYNCLDQDDLKGLGLMNGEPLEHRDYIFYLQDKLAGKWE